MRVENFKFTIGDLVSVLDEELKDLKIKNKHLRNKLTSCMVSHILSHSKVTKNNLRVK